MGILWIWPGTVFSRPLASRRRRHGLENQRVVAYPLGPQCLIRGKTSSASAHSRLFASSFWPSVSKTHGWVWPHSSLYIDMEHFSSKSSSPMGRTFITSISYTKLDSRRSKDEVLTMGKLDVRKSMVYRIPPTCDGTITATSKRNLHHL